MIDFVGAGTAIAVHDQEPRGHNFNIVVVEESGLYYIRQFFAPPGEPFREIPGAQFPSGGIDSAFFRSLGVGHKVAALHLAVDIDEEGDSLSELHYMGVTSCSGTPIERLRLPKYEVDSGHLSPVYLFRNKTSEHVELQMVKDTPQTIQFDLVFGRPVSERSPTNFCVRSYDLNVFCMNVQEHRRQHPDRAVAIDWVEKEIAEPVEHLTMEIRFPHSMAFLRLPTFEVVTSTPPHNRHDCLTAALQPWFRFSEVLRTAFLSIQKPPMGYNFRISWEYGDHTPGKPSQTPVERFRLQRFVSLLLRIREQILSGTFESEAGAAVEESVLRTLAGFASVIEEHLQQLTGVQSALDPDKLDLTLMVCDDLDPNNPPKLRIVAGTNLKLPHYRDFTLGVGDGIAGRAYKARCIRTYRDRDAHVEPKKHAYLRIDGVRRHEILFCLPLISEGNQEIIYGILNIGTFDAEQAAVLGALETAPEMEWMSSSAQSFVLKRLLEVVRI